MKEFNRYFVLEKEGTNHGNRICTVQQEGGDGTLNRFINDTAKIDIHCEISYYPTGTGNDFAREVKNTNAQTLYPITAYLKDLPMVEILKGQEITVAFDEPRPPQIDGKTIFNISSYTASVPKGREETLC